MKKRTRKRPKRISKEAREIIARAKELRELLAEFGLALCGFDPGVTATFLKNPPPFAVGAEGSGCFGEPISFNRTEWDWLKPLLIELLAKRAYLRRGLGG